MNKPQSTDEAFEKLLTAWEANDFEGGKSLLNHICKNTNLDDLEKRLLVNIDAATGIFGLFVETGLSESPVDTPTGEFCIRVVNYIFNFCKDYGISSAELFGVVESTPADATVH